MLPMIRMARSSTSTASMIERMQPLRVLDPCVQLVGHQSRESVDPLRVDSGSRSAPDASMVKCHLGSLTLGLQRSGTLPQDVVQFDDAVLDGAVEPLWAIFSIAQFLPQGEQPVIGRFTLRGLAFDQRFQEIGDSIRPSTCCLRFVRTISSKVAAGIWRPLQTVLPFCWQPAQE